MLLRQLLLECGDLLFQFIEPLFALFRCGELLLYLAFLPRFATAGLAVTRPFAELCRLL
jgi:hypothetical protein